MLFEAQSTKSIEDIDRGLREAAVRHQFGILGVINLREKMRDKGVEFDRDCLVYEVCNPHQAKRVLDANGAISTALPCRISVYGKPGDHRIATLLPTVLMQGFNTPGIDDVARQVEDAMIQMVREAAG